MEAQKVSSNQVFLEIIENDVAIVRLGRADERVVTLTRERIESLRQALNEITNKQLRGVVFMSPNEDMFTAGADINLIQSVTDAKQGEALAREGQLLFEQIANLKCTTVAAISGPCVGGGCEMVLACRYRVASNSQSTQIGLPETKLGILPGFGGTQRLPRLIGISRALDIILAGKTLTADKSLRAGLVDKVVNYEELLATGLKFARGAEKSSRPKLKFFEKFLTYSSLGLKVVKRKVEQDLVNKTKGFYPAPLAALKCVLYGLKHGHTDGLKLEAEELGKLIVTPECKALVNLFFLTEASKGLGKSARKDLDHVNTVVIGAGIMGAGIAGTMARSGSSVTIKDVNQPALDRAMDHIKKNLATVSDRERSFILNRIETTVKDTASVSNANLIIEAVFEDINLKKQILADMQAKVSANAILATNTSSLSVTEIASVLQNPSRVVGMHFFNPVEKMPLVEIIQGEQTSDKTIALIAALTAKIKKFPIVVRDVPGFLVNRVLFPYLNESAFLLGEGYSISDIDKAALDFGMPMGPLRLIDEVGLDVGSHVLDIMEAGYGERMTAPKYLKTMVAAGRKGRKSGGGFYDFKGKETTAYPRIRELLDIKTESKTVFDLKPIQDRLILSLVNEAVRCLDEGVAGYPSKEAANQVDLGTVMGIGFPPFRGGVLYYANSIGAKTIQEKLSKLEKEHGLRFKPADGITSRAKSGKNFHEKM